MGWLTGNGAQEVVTTLQEGIKPLKWIEEFFAGASDGQLALSEVLLDKTRTQLDSQMKKVVELQDKISQFNFANIKSSARQGFILLQERLNDRIPKYQQSVELYDTVYEAFTKNDPKLLSGLIGSDNYYTSMVSGRLYDFLEERKQIQDQLIKNDCENNMSETCTRLREAEIDQIVNLSGNALVPAIFTAYYDGIYEEENLMSPLADKLLKEL